VRKGGTRPPGGLKNPRSRKPIRFITLYHAPRQTRPEVEFHPKTNAEIALPRHPPHSHSLYLKVEPDLRAGLLRSEALRSAGLGSSLCRRWCAHRAILLTSRRRPARNLRTEAQRCRPRIVRMRPMQCALRLQEVGRVILNAPRATRLLSDTPTWSRGALAAVALFRQANKRASIEIGRARI